MKTLKIVFAAVAVLFLSLSLSGCDGCHKTASNNSTEKTLNFIGTTQGEGVPDASGVATFRFPAGTKELLVGFRTAENRHLSVLKQNLLDAGIHAKNIVLLANTRLIVEFDTLKKDVIVRMNVNSVLSIQPALANGTFAFYWYAPDGFIG